MKGKVFVTRQILPVGLHMLREAGFEVDVWEQALPPERETLINRAKDAVAVISMLSDKIDQSVIDSLPNVKVITNYAVGINNIDVDYAKSKGIFIGNTPDVLTLATAELALSLTFAAARNLKGAHQFIEQGKWKTWGPMDLLGKQVTGSKVGIIGAGRIGQAYARMLHGGFGCEIFYHCPNKKPEFEKEVNAKYMELEELLKDSDVVALHLPLTDKSKNLINEDTIKFFKDGAIFINTARGEIHDEKVLLNALRTNKLFSIGLDVTNPEPMSPQSELFNHEKVIVAPHIGSGTFKAREDMSIIVARNIINNIK